MAIINCPACNKRISSVAISCDYCSTVFNGEDDEESYRKARNLRYSKLQKLQNFSFIFVLLFTIGAMALYLGITNNDQLYNSIGRVTLSIGFVGYIGTRAMLVYIRRS